MSIKVIGFCGLARAGKTTAQEAYSYGVDADNIHRQHITKITLISFADPIKKALKELGLTKEDNPERYRKMAQIVGEGLRASDPDAFIKIAHNTIKRTVAEHELKTNMDNFVFIFDDVRYENEVKFINDCVAGDQGEVYFIDAYERLKDLVGDFLSPKPPYNHHSEEMALRMTAIRLGVKHHLTVAGGLVQPICNNITLDEYTTKLFRMFVNPITKGCGD